MRLPLLALILTGCATTASEPFSDPQGLAKAIGPRIASGETSCVSTSLLSDTQVIDGSTIIYGRVGTIYVNRMERPCPGLDPTDTLITDIKGGQLCRNDMIRVLEPGSTIPGGFCRLGSFTTYRLPRQPGG